MVAGWRWEAVAMALTANAAACSGTAPSGSPRCEPSCVGRACGEDGCGGVCGGCPSDSACSAAGQCEATSGGPDCTKRCSDLAYACGEHCGEACGACGGAQEACVDHGCVCQPACDAARCETPDGCGTLCGPCPRDVSCADCPLALSVVGRKVVDGRVRTVTLALDYLPPVSGGGAVPLPGMADLRIAIGGEAELVQVATGPAVIAAHKGLFMNPATGRPFRVLEGGAAVSLLVHATDNQEPIGAGRWLVLEFRLGPADGVPGAGPYTFAIQPRDGTLAPTAADAALWGASLGDPVSVWPDALDGDEVPHAP